MIHQNDDAQAEVVPDEDTLRRIAGRAFTQWQAEDFGLIALAARRSGRSVDVGIDWSVR
jgi:hypothetical protein